jgi:hypothetical protein
VKLTREQIQARRAELEAMKSNPKLEEQELFHQIQKSIGVQGILGAGDLVKNQTNALASLLTGGKIPYKETKSGEGGAYETGKFLMEMGEMMSPTTWARRLLASAGFGALGNPEEAAKGAGVGLIFGLGGEALNPALKGAGGLFREKIIEPLSLDKASKEVSATIKNMFGQAKDKAWGKVGPMMDKHGKENLLTMGSYGEIVDSGWNRFKALLDEKKDLYTADFKKLVKEFDRKPNISNGQKLVEKLGVDERRIRYSEDPTKELKESTYDESKEYIREVITNRMEKLEPGFTDTYKEANLDYAINVSPFYSSEAVENAAVGNIRSLSEISEGITKGSENVRGGYPSIGAEHGLMGLNKSVIEPALGVSEMVPQGPAKFVPIFGTPRSRETAYKFGNKTVDYLTPTMRALLQSQNTPLTIEIDKFAGYED